MANELVSTVAVVLSRRKRFYSKRFLLGAFASKAARQLMSTRVSLAIAN